jgi:hypothetical protein
MPTIFIALSALAKVKINTKARIQIKAKNTAQTENPAQGILLGQAIDKAPAHTMQTIQAIDKATASVPTQARCKVKT